MNRRSLGLKPSQALTGFIQHKTAEGLSPNTLRSYEHIFRVWSAHVGDVQLDQITTQDIREFLAWLRTDYKPRRFSGNERPLSPKSLRNAWIALCGFFKWVSTEFNLDNPMKTIPAPRFQEPPIEPFSKEEIEALLKASEYSKEANTDQRKKFSMRRVTARRDRAMILILLDTGLRASEFCSLKIGDVDMKSGRVEVKHGVLGGAKGGKGRTVFRASLPEMPYGDTLSNVRIAGICLRRYLPRSAGPGLAQVRSHAALLNNLLTTATNSANTHYRQVAQQRS